MFNESHRKCLGVLSGVGRETTGGGVKTCHSTHGPCEVDEDPWTVCTTEVRRTETCTTREGKGRLFKRWSF